MPGNAKVNGTWKELVGVNAKVNGTWKEVAEGYTKVNGTWQQWFTSVSSAMELIQSYSFSSNFTTFTISNIPQDYETIFITMNLAATTTGDIFGSFAVNGSLNSSYHSAEWDTFFSGNQGYTDSDNRFPMPLMGSDSSYLNLHTVTIHKYSTNEANRIIGRTHAAAENNSGTKQAGYGGTLRTDLVSSINNVTIFNAQYSQASEIRLYGIRGV